MSFYVMACEMANILLYISIFILLMIRCFTKYFEVIKKWKVKSKLKGWVRAWFTERKCPSSSNILLGNLASHYRREKKTEKHKERTNIKQRMVENFVKLFIFPLWWYKHTGNWKKERSKRKLPHPCHFLNSNVLPLHLFVTYFIYSFPSFPSLLTYPFLAFTASSPTSHGLKSLKSLEANQCFAFDDILI